MEVVVEEKDEEEEVKVKVLEEGLHMVERGIKGDLTC